MHMVRAAIVISEILLTSSLQAQWIQTNGPYGALVRSPAVSGTNLFAGTGGGVFLSTNNGTSWNAVNAGLPNSKAWSLAVSGQNLFAGTQSYGVYLSTNNGTSWSAVNTGLRDTYVNTLALSGTNLFGGTVSGSVWRRPLSQMVTSMEKLSADLPTHFALDQNYPNSFNPSTRISFTLPCISFASLRVFDTLGREV